MTVLLVEDDDNKRQNVEGWLHSTFGGMDVRLSRSVHSALCALLASCVDLLILDMTLPTFDITVDEDGGRPQAFGGREVLRQLERRRIRTPVVVLTQFQRFGVGSDAVDLGELDEQLRAAHPGNYIKVIYYDPAVHGWKAELEELITEIRELNANTDC